jgi:hypothetical protein
MLRKWSTLPLGNGFDCVRLPIGKPHSRYNHCGTLEPESLIRAPWEHPISKIWFGASSQKRSMTAFAGLSFWK